MTRLRRSILATVAAVALGGALFAGGVAADELSRTYDVGVASCAHATSQQLCDPVQTVEVSTEGVLRVQFTAASTHCAPVIAHLFVDGSERFVSGPLGPGESAPTQDFGPVTAGSHTLGVQAEGVVGGCNAGTTSSWAGTLAVAVSGAPAVTPTPAAVAPTPAAVEPTPTPVPGSLGSGAGADYTPLLLGFAGLVIAGSAVTWYALRRRRLALPEQVAYPPDPVIPPDPVTPPDQIDEGGPLRG